MSNNSNEPRNATENPAAHAPPTLPLGTSANGASVESATAPFRLPWIAIALSIASLLALLASTRMYPAYAAGWLAREEMKMGIHASLKISGICWLAAILVAAWAIGRARDRLACFALFLAIAPQAVLIIFLLGVRWYRMSA